MTEGPPCLHCRERGSEFRFSYVHMKMAPKYRLSVTSVTRKYFGVYVRRH